MPTYTSEQLAAMDVVSNTEAAFESANPIVPENVVYYSVDTNMARVGDGSTTWGALVPFLYGENLDVNVVQKITGSWQGIALPSENTVPSTYAVDEALTDLKEDITNTITTNVNTINKTIEKNELANEEKFGSIDAQLSDLGELSKDISNVISRVDKITDDLKPNSSGSIIYEVKTDITELENDVTSLTSTVNSINSKVNAIPTFPLAINKGGTGETTNAGLKNLIENLGFQLKTTGTNTTATTASKLATPRNIKVYTYTNGAGNIMSSKIYNMSGSANFDGSTPIEIGMLAATYTNCNCRCDDDY